MIRRLASAAAALGLVALLVILPGAAPAAAAPGPLAGQCSVKEWQNPGNWGTCTDRLNQGAQQTVDCKTPPPPDSPDAGVGGLVTRRPDAATESGPSGRYTLYGVAGDQLPIYDLGCIGKITHADAQFETTIANGGFEATEGIVGAAGTLRNLAYNPATTWGWSDGLVKALSAAGFGWLFNPLAALTFAGIGLWLMWRAPRGNLAETTHTVGWALGITIIVIIVARFPLQITGDTDRAGTATLAAIHSVIAPSPDDLPPDLCAQIGASAGKDACKDHRSVADRASDDVTDAVLYRSWLAAEFGSADSPTAKKYGPALFDAGTLTWVEADGLRQDPRTQADVYAAKAKRWQAIAEQIKTEDPVAYDHLRGLYGWGRIANAAAAAFSAGCFAVFDVTASIVILLGFGVVRFGVVLLPVLGVVGLFRPASGDVRRLFHAVAGSLVNIGVFGTVSALYLRLVDAVYTSNLDALTQMVAVLAAGVGCLLMLRPKRRLAALAGRVPTTDGAEGDGKRRFAFLRRVTTAPAVVTPPTDPPRPPAAPAAPPVRPESHTPTASAPPSPTSPAPAAVARPRPEAFTGSSK